MNNRDARKTTQVVVDAVSFAKERAVLATGWGSLSEINLPDTIYRVNAIPHDWLFPHMAAVVHHGGAGTTAAALRAGIPSVIVPHMMDQPFWGRRIFDLGAGPQPIPQRQLTAERLTNANTVATTDKEMKRQATTLAAEIQAEDGTVKAVELATSYLAEAR